ncbi:hypothetical protein [Sphingomonas sp. RS2018]
MRIAALALVPAILVAAPAAAQDRPPVADVARALNDPVMQEGAAAALAALAGIVLDTRVGPLAQWVDPSVRPNATLRDLKRRDDPDFERRLRADTRRGVAVAGAAAGDAAVMAGEVARTTDRLRAAIAPLAGMLASAADDY